MHLQCIHSHLVQLQKHKSSVSLSLTLIAYRAVIVSFNSHENVSFFVLAKLVQKGSKYLIEEGGKLDAGFTTVFYKFTIRFLHRTWQWFRMDCWLKKYFKFPVLEIEWTVYTLCTIKWSNRLHAISMPKFTCSVHLLLRFKEQVCNISKSAGVQIATDCHHTCTHTHTHAYGHTHCSITVSGSQHKGPMHTETKQGR